MRLLFCFVLNYKTLYYSLLNNEKKKNNLIDIITQTIEYLFTFELSYAKMKPNIQRKKTKKKSMIRFNNCAADFRFDVNTLNNFGRLAQKRYTRRSR